MLVLTRKKDESIVIDGRITVRVVKVEGGKVRLAIEAPRELRVDRGEVHARIAGGEAVRREGGAA